MKANQFVSLVSINSFGKLVLNSSSIETLKSLNSPISVATIVGPQHSGKSFLLRHCTTPMSQSLSRTQTESSTQGLQIYSKPHLAYCQNGRVSSVLFLDSQGINPNHNIPQSKLLAFILLISNCILYNTRTQFSSQIETELKILISAIKQITNGKSRLGKSDLHWIFRDYISGNNPCNSPEIQFQNFLRQSSTYSEDCNSKILKQYFQNRDCHYLTHPFSGTQIDPIFTEQAMKLRKKITNLPSLDIDGTSLIELISTFISSLNNGQTFQKVAEQGQDCLIRLKCIDRFKEELQSLQQEKSMNSIDELSEKQSEIRISIKQFYMQKMKTSKQIKILENQLNGILEQFQELNEYRFQSTNKLSDYYPHLHYLQVTPPQPQKMMRVSLNISEADKERIEGQVKPFKSLDRINESKSLHCKLEEYQTKLLRLQLQANATQAQVQYFRSQASKSKHELELKSDQLQSMAETFKFKQSEFKLREEQLSQAIIQLKRQKMMEVSEKERQLMLSNDKIQYLQNQLQNLINSYQSEKKEREEKYRNRINQYLVEIAQLKESHEEEVAQLKAIYKKNTERLTQSNNGDMPNTFFQDFTSQISLIDSLQADNQRYKYQKNELENNNKLLTEKLTSLEDKLKNMTENSSKRMKQLQKHYQSLLLSHTTEKQIIIGELKQRINLLVSTSQQQSHYQQQSLLQYKHEIEELQHQLAQKINNIEQFNVMISRLKTEIEQLKRQLEKMTVYRCQEAKKNVQLQTDNEQLNLKINSLQVQLHNIKIQTQQRQTQYLKEIQLIKEQLSTSKTQAQAVQLSLRQQLLKVQTINIQERSDLQAKIIGLSRSVEELKQIKFQLQEQKNNLIYNELQLNMKIQQLQKSANMLKEQILQLQRQNDSKDQQITFLNSSIATLNLHLAQQSAEYTLNPHPFDDEQLSVPQPTKQYLKEITKLQTSYFALQQEYNKEKSNWKKREEELHKQIGQNKRRQYINNQDQKTNSRRQSQQLLRLSKERQNLNNQLIILNEKYSYLKTQNDLQINQKNSTINKLTKSAQLAKQQLQLQIKSLKQQVFRLTKTINILQQQRIISNQNFQTLRQQLQSQKIKNQSYLALYQQKNRQLKVENQHLSTKMQQYIADHQQIVKNKVLLEHNFEANMKLQKIKNEHQKPN